MKNLKRIVVGIDFSIFSSRVLEYASSIAKRNTAQLLIVSVIDQGEIDYVKEVCEHEDPEIITLEKYIDDETTKLTHNLEKMILDLVPKSVSTKPIIMIGVPYEEILKVVDVEKADLVVMSSKGRTNFHDYMFGTTSEKVFRHCPVSVLSLNLRA
ncbi:MAG: nucleotide-binding universal stress UspA family protein [Desulforhopalus sp.]|jgi:nucleotide-binding universal stress UspA family protein